MEVTHCILTSTVVFGLFKTFYLACNGHENSEFYTPLDQRKTEVGNVFLQWTGLTVLGTTCEQMLT